MSDFKRIMVESILAGINDLYSSESSYHINDICLGVSYSGLILANGVMGIAHTALPDHKGRFCHPKKAGDLMQKMSIEEHVELFSSSNPLERTLGLISINSLSQTLIQSLYDLEEAKGTPTIIDVKKGQKVGMIGEITPLISRFVNMGAKILVIDRDKPISPREGVTQAQSLSKLNDQDHLFVTGTAMLYDDFSDVIDLKTKGKKIIVGPSAQILPEIPFRFGFDIVASSFIMDPRVAMRIIREGGGYDSIKRVCRKYVIQAP